MYLTIRHDTTARESFADGVLLALEKLDSLPAGLTVGLDALLEERRIGTAQWGRLSRCPGRKG